MREFDEILRQRPGLVEAHINRGYCLVGLGRFTEARSAFEHAIDLRPAQANSYYGLALSLEGQGDLFGASGAMRAFVHLVSDDNPHRRKGLAAIWEWSESTGMKVKDS